MSATTAVPVSASTIPATTITSILTISWATEIMLILLHQSTSGTRYWKPTLTTEQLTKAT